MSSEMASGSSGSRWAAPGFHQGGSSNNPTFIDIKPTRPSSISPPRDVKPKTTPHQPLHGVDIAALLERLEEAKQAWEALKGGDGSAEHAEALARAQEALHEARRVYKSAKARWTETMEAEALQEYRARKHHWKDLNNATQLPFADCYNAFFSHDMEQPRPWSLFQHEKFEWKRRKWRIEVEDRVALAKNGAMLERKKRLEEARAARQAAVATKAESEAIQAKAAPLNAREGRELHEARVRRATVEAEAAAQGAREAGDQRAEELAARREATLLGHNQNEFVERRGLSPPILAAPRPRAKPPKAKPKAKPKPKKKKKPSAAQMVKKERKAAVRKAKKERSKVKAETVVKTESGVQRELTVKREVNVEPRVHVKTESEARVKSERL